MKRVLVFLLVFSVIFSFVSCKNTDVTKSEETIAETQVESVVDINNTVDYSTPITEVLIESIVSKEYTKAKNIIVLIGDGMGPNDIAMAEKYADGVYDFGLVLNKIKNHGMAQTRSANNSITDSAASGTALSTGVKTDNGMVGISPDGKNLQTMAETARNAGKKVGIVTDDQLYGATPSAFVTHSNYRYNYEELCHGILSFSPDVIIGSSYEDYSSNLNSDSKKLFDEKYSIAHSLEEFGKAADISVADGKPFAGFNGGCKDYPSDHLAVSVQTALPLLENENGFFLMVESCGTDVYGHSNEIKGKMSSVVTLDRALSTILLFMEKNPDTLLIVTSDHETGGVSLPETGETPTNELFSVATHTSTDVRVFCVGEESVYFKNKLVDNTDIGKFVKNAIEG